MSGGVDSSVVAALLHARGHDVIGMTLQLYDHGQAVKKAGACCAGQDIHDARRVAQACGFPHYVLDNESRFRQTVIDQFVPGNLACWVESRGERWWEWVSARVAPRTITTRDCWCRILRELTAR
ncbi:MAG: asparagine synthase-related protein, partial [Pseudomonadota bacterium]